MKKRDSEYMGYDAPMTGREWIIALRILALIILGFASVITAVIYKNEIKTAVVGTFRSIMSGPKEEVTGYYDDEHRTTLLKVGVDFSNGETKYIWHDEPGFKKYSADIPEDHRKYQPRYLMEQERGKEK